jgi:hypothetical protein
VKKPKQFLIATISNLQTENFQSEPRLSRRGFTYFPRIRGQVPERMSPQRPLVAHMATQHVDQGHAASIRQVLVDVADALGALDLDDCDTSDVQEVIDKTLAELSRPIPNTATLGTYLNSLARSLRSQPSVRTVVLELDAVMREANVPTTWEH